MDAQVFGAFVQARRKELGVSQAELAERIHVTAKAVSRWERGVGFPDIKLLEPLAEALELTIVELMQSKRIEKDIPKEEAAEMVSRTVNTLQEQGKISLRRKIRVYFYTALIIAAEFFLLWVSNTYDFEPRWIGLVIHYIGLMGGIYGVRAVRHILLGEPMRGLDNPMWKKWQNRLAMWIFTLCCLGLMLLLGFTAGQKSILRDAAVVVLLVPLAASFQYVYQQWREQEKKE